MKDKFVKKYIFKDERPDNQYNSQELQWGIEIEMEHSDDEAISKRIAKDHLDEIPDYYTRLRAMEKSAGISESIWNKANYPTEQEVITATDELITYWYENLPNPTSKKEGEIMDSILDAFHDNEANSWNESYIIENLFKEIEKITK